MRVLDPSQESSTFHPDIHLVENDTPVSFGFFEIVSEHTESIEVLSHDTSLSRLTVEECTRVIFVVLTFLQYLLKVQSPTRLHSRYSNQVA